ncbi:putative leader peptide [Cryptosporangium minutisporangium]
MTGRTRLASALLTTRRHVDFLRVSSAVCRPS